MSPTGRRPWRYRGRRREGAVRDWPVGFTPMTDPWSGSPLFSWEHERQRQLVTVAGESSRWGIRNHVSA